ncbi:hypothetical protein EBAPG3_010535 [Nitrosospira lacus]|uniref:Uncharacterized protein n=1 Tax=Nitrosospira lacus TaxID=1288494 RepID=A0A1W6SQW6_9PROT|nr:hypothetical protein [Nitrosospira lacus]ARO88179.1 hypothetical protein EBAPG3_010535 [Nitrosospira lacus]
MNTDKTALPATGGSYTVCPDTGVLTQTQAPTADHPEGNRPRPSEADDADAAPIEEAVSKTKKGAK